MARLKKALVLEISLPETFYDRLRNELEEELLVAQTKWGVKLPRDEQERILQHSKNQLESKVLSIAAPWAIGDPVLTISVVHPRAKKVKLPSKAKTLDGLQLVRPKAQWEVAETETEDSVDIYDFAKHIEDTLVTWGRTAVFYGVGSEA